MAMGSRASIDAAVLTARAALDLNPDLVLLSLDGIGAFNHIYTGEMLARLNEFPGACEMLPFIRLFYGQPSRYLFEDELGVVHTIWQGEGGEQGDALYAGIIRFRH